MYKKTNWFTAEELNEMEKGSDDKDTNEEGDNHKNDKTLELATKNKPEGEPLKRIYSREKQLRERFTKFLS